MTKSNHQYSQEDQTLLELSHSLGSFQGHHHHHHHHHHSNVTYQRPKQLTNSLGLYSLKKLSAMNPKLLSVYQRRLLEPVAPGFLTYFTYASLCGVGAAYGTYIFRGYGYKAFISKPVLGMFAIYGFSLAAQYGMNYFREQLYTPQRNRLVDQYRMRFGQEYLLDVLDPSFKLN